MLSEDGPIGPVYEQVVYDIAEGVTLRDFTNQIVFTNRVLRKLLVHPMLEEMLVEAGVHRGD